MEAYFDTKGLADHLGVSVQAVQAWRIRGTGPRGFRAGRVVRYRRAEVARWVAEQERATQSRGLREASAV